MLHVVFVLTLFLALPAVAVDTKTPPAKEPPPLPSPAPLAVKDVAPGSAVRGEVQIKQQRPVYSNPFGTLYDDEVLFPGNISGTYLRFSWNKPNLIGVLPVLSSGEVVLIEHYRHPLRRWIWEIPRGMGDDNDLEALARQELKEEVGVHDCTLSKMGVITPDSGILTYEVKLFLATGCQRGKVERERDTGTVRNVRYISFKNFEAMIQSGEITDSFSIVAMHRARPRLLRR
ncbi:MAG: hypothetical protein A2284_17640 [Deltaproteobacteria bacterium RIFOXYA12_FULL_61_11]|nr:MAG: hypothetical protein A2284_17640 [Deltaproteobacteria bacterium RIFOXYA12_FULL_61_11]